MLSSAEIGTLITALGTGIGQEEFDVGKIRYHKVIIMTDADVDGSHIRTLLLTFFYRQMPKVIEQGYLYIAQPPLYKVVRGKSERYLKDDKAFEDFLVDEGLENAVLQLADGSRIGGADLRRLVDRARAVRGLAASLGRRYDRVVVEQAAIAGVLSPDRLATPEQAQAAAETLARRLDQIADPTERGWRGEATADAIRVSRKLRGMPESAAIDLPLLRSVEARRLAEVAGELAHIYGTSPVLERKEERITLHSATELVDKVTAIGRRGLSIQRYKGLGEMNPEQLWETTLDPEVRSLLQVKVAHADEADNVFESLMGDVVEPRREFIQANALNVANLDV
jgi:DNA gyrase subunit B